MFDMKTTRFFYTMVLAVMASGAITLTSCSKDDDNEPKPVEKTLVEKIESVTFSVTGTEKRIVIDGSDPITVTYDVKQSELASLLAVKKELFSIIGVEAPAALTITNVEGNAYGKLILTLEPSGFEPEKNYRMALVIKDEKATYTTEYTDIYVVQSVGVDPDERNQDQAESR